MKFKDIQGFSRIFKKKFKDFQEKIQGFSRILTVFSKRFFFKMYSNDPKNRKFPK